MLWRSTNNREEQVHFSRHLSRGPMLILNVISRSLSITYTPTRSTMGWLLILEIGHGVPIKLWFPIGQAASNVKKCSLFLMIVTTLKPPIITIERYISTMVCCWISWLTSFVKLSKFDKVLIALVFPNLVNLVHLQKIDEVYCVEQENWGELAGDILPAVPALSNFQSLTKL